MRKLPNIGDWVFVTKSSSNISEEMFKQIYGDRGLFGKVIEIDPKRFSPYTGEPISPIIVVRAYTKYGRRHYTTSKNKLKLVS